MPLVFDLKESHDDRTVPITIEGAGSFEVIIRPPTLGAELSFWTDRQSGNKRRLQEAVVGWQGLQDAKGQDIPFSPDALAALCRRYPSAGLDIAAAVLDLYGEPGEDERKNSEAPPSSGAD